MRALIAGAALLAGATAPAAQAQTQGGTTGSADETAMAFPRLHGGGASLPQPLSATDAARVRRIFTAQSRGDIPAAIRDTDALDDTMLLGTLLADRYLGRGKPTAADLAAWLDRFADHPDARAVFATLARQKPGTTAPTFAPILEASTSRLPDDLDTGPRAVSAPVARAEMARVLLTQDRARDAMKMADAALHATPDGARAGLPSYVAGLAAWRMGKPFLARVYFEQTAEAERAAPWLRAAGAYWAGRAHVRAGDPDGAAPWLRAAARKPHTFYGLLARRTLELGRDADAGRDILSIADVDAIASYPAGMRAFALLQVGQRAKAEAEFRALWPRLQDAPGVAHALMLVARDAGLSGLASQLAAMEDDATDIVRDDPRLQMPKLSPRGGFRVDPSLIYALTKIESNFDPMVVSGAGARGLMQLMPVTASTIARNPELGDASSTLLHDPGVNLDLGQRYVQFLAQQDGIKGNLIYLLASYNVGPAAVARWPAAANGVEDPLLFIESIPSPHARAFVQEALSFSWVYAARLDLPTPSLDDLAAGQFPRVSMVAAKPRTLH